MKDVEAEIKLLLEIIKHPAGYDIGLFGVMSVRSTDQLTWEVEWEEYSSSGQSVTTHWLSFDNPEDAVRKFVEMRHERELGLDIEAELCRMAGLI